MRIISDTVRDFKTLRIISDERSMLMFVLVPDVRRENFNV